MAKRKRLSPALTGFLSATPAEPPAPAPPIAQVAGEASATAALAELSAEIADARAGGRLIELLPLDAIDEAHLVRDRLEQDEDEMAALMASLQARGQQTPIEVIALPGETDRYGLISGWRRLTALRRLSLESDEPRFAVVKALVTAPESAQDAYVAMVEENEIRVNLSHYERARIAKRAVEEGVFEDLRAALQGLYGAATRSKRSKIGSFVTVVEALDTHLRFPTAISEKLGLALAKHFAEVPEAIADLHNRLATETPTDAAEELTLLQAALTTRASVPEENSPQPPSPAPSSSAPPAPQRDDVTRYDIASGLVIRHWDGGERIEISGHQVDAAFCRALRNWMESR